MKKNNILNIGVLLILNFLFLTDAFSAFPVKSQDQKSELKSKSKSNKEIPQLKNLNLNQQQVAELESLSEEASSIASAPSAAYSGKSQLVAALLCILFGLGNFGLHDFYLGNTKKGLIKLAIGGLGLVLLILGLLSVSVTTPLPILMIIGGLIWMTASIMTIIDFIRIIIGNNYPGL